MNLTTPFWQQDITEKLLSGIITPVDVVSNYILATPDEIKNIDFNFNATGGLPNYQRFLGPYKLEDIPSEFHPDFMTTVDRALELQDMYGYELIPTNLFRSMKHHRRIYHAKGIADKDIPLLSKHLFAQAVDLVPKNKPIEHLHKFVTEKVLEDLNVWQEHERHTPRWLHIQITQYGSWVSGKSRKYNI